MCNKKLFRLVLLLSLLITPDNFFAAEAERKPKEKPPDKAAFVLSVKDDLISLRAKDALLREILEELGHRMKIDVVASIPHDAKITEEFDKLSIEEAVNRLSRNYSYAIVMDSTKGEKRISKIIVLEKGKETALTKPTAPASTIEREQRSVKPETRSKEEPTRKISPPQEPFKFEIDPSRYGEKRRYGR